MKSKLELTELGEKLPLDTINRYILDLTDVVFCYKDYEGEPLLNEVDKTHTKCYVIGKSFEHYYQSVDYF